ncbi:MAG TPA: aminoacetone oxidase family FAD-binding enzyme [Planctomycetota bacterium]|nr:aminoacetone oxidase family FAD-binding enzyme [Planctomycetota bacterium]
MRETREREMSSDTEGAESSSETSVASDSYDVIVVGAGAAGLTAAIFARRRGASVLLLETRPKPGAKIRVSGGGRCNVLPSRAELSDFHTGGSVKAMRNVLFSWPLADVRRFFEEELGVPLVIEEETGKLFPKSQDARDVVEALLAECARLGVELRSSERVLDVLALEVVEDGARAASTPSAIASSATGVERPAELAAPCVRPPRFEVSTVSGARFRGRSVLLATGGKSLPRTGSDGHGFAIARSLGHSTRPTFPVLVPLHSDADPWRSLPGIALRAELIAVRDGRELARREGDFLFTHRGFSGPVVLDMSRFITRESASADDGTDAETGDAAKVELRARWLGGAAPDWSELLASGGRRAVVTALSSVLPRRLASLLVEDAGVPADRRACDLRRDERSALLERLERCPLPISSDEGYATAEATGGGIALEDLHLRSLESRIVPGLHFAGEIIDVDGRIGGFNFLWAWVSGRRAGEGAAGEGRREPGKDEPSAGSNALREPSGCS